MTGYISVSEYAEKYGLYQQNIRRLISEGRIEASKIGNQWAIPDKEPRPEDRRVKSGRYKGWRKGTKGENPPE